MYFVTMEVAQAIEANKKVGRVGSMVADLVTQQQDDHQSPNSRRSCRSAKSTLQPYNRSRSRTIIITAIEITDEATPQVKVAWSRKLVNGAFSVAAAKDSVTTVPAGAEDQGQLSGPRREPNSPTRR